MFGIWTAVVSLLALVDALGWWKDYADGAHSVGLGFAQTMASSLTWVLVNISVYLLTVWFPVGRPRVVRAVLVHVAGYLVTLCWLSGRMFLFDPVLHWLPPGRGFGAEYLRDLGAYLAMYLEWVGVAHGVYYFTQCQRRRDQLLAGPRAAGPGQAAGPAGAGPAAFPVQRDEHHRLVRP
ncbi:hypothetical protein AB0L06_05450 [Spirillospora sp. NPDC052269]